MFEDLELDLSDKFTILGNFHELRLHGFEKSELILDYINTIINDIKVISNEISYTENLL